MRVAFYGKSQQLFVASDNTTCFSWDVATGNHPVTLTGFLSQRDAGGLNYDPNFYWQSSIAKYIRFKNSLLLSRDGKTLLKGKFGTKVKRWNIATGQTVMEYGAHTKAVLCYDLSRDGKRLLTGGGDGRIMLWDVATGDSIMSINAYREPIFDIHFNANETQVYSSSWDASLQVHDISSGQRLTYLDLKNASAYVLAVHPSDLYVITSRLDNTLQMWEPDTHSGCAHLYRSHRCGRLAAPYTRWPDAAQRRLGRFHTSVGHRHRPDDSKAEGPSRSRAYGHLQRR